VSDWTCLQPGFPIRTPSDHSSVASSSRLIAGSYVLHRLLVPRHPPYALINLPYLQHLILSTTTPTPESVEAIHRRTQRCSRPLYSSQATNRHPPHTHHLPASPSKRRAGGLMEGEPAEDNRSRNSRPHGLFPQDPTACHEPHPNPQPAFPTGHPAVLTAQKLWPRLSCRCSTREQPPQHERLQQADPEHPHPATQDQEQDAKCSLERR
jgi:hypothetical protein